MGVGSGPQVNTTVKTEKSLPQHDPERSAGSLNRSAGSQNSPKTHHDITPPIPHQSPSPQKPFLFSSPILEPMSPPPKKQKKWVKQKDPQENFMKLYSVAPTPIKLEKMIPYLKLYPSQKSQKIIDGFTNGFPLHFQGAPDSYIAKNHLSAITHSDIVTKKIEKELELGRIIGPFDQPPLPNFRSSPIGLVPKKSSNPDPSSVDNWRFIHDLSTFPKVGSVNEGIPDEYGFVEYAKFDNLIDMLVKLGKGARMAKADLKSAFRTIPMQPSDFHCLGFSHEGKFYVNATMPMGAKVSCATFEEFSTFLEWAIKHDCGYEFIMHYIDDFIFIGPPESPICGIILMTFDKVTQIFCVPVAPEKRVTPCTLMEFLGLLVDTVLQQVKIPEDKLKDIKAKVDHALTLKKVSLKELQSLIGSLQFLCRAVAPGRPFIRRLSYMTAKVSKPWHKVRMSLGCKDDLTMWKSFLDHYNGVTFFRDVEWTPKEALNLYTDASDWGMGLFYDGRWAYSQWLGHEEYFRDINFREILAVGAALATWGTFLSNKKVLFHCDNMAMVEAITNNSSHCPYIMAIIRYIVLQCLKYNIMMKCVHIPGLKNVFADQVSRGKFTEFLQECKTAMQEPDQIPGSVWQILKNTHLT